MKYAIQFNGQDTVRDRIAEELSAALAKNGYTRVPMEEKLEFILNWTTFDNPPAVIRKAQSEFVISIATVRQPVGDLRFLCYNALVKTLSNMLLCIKPGGNGQAEIFCITPEAGFYHFPYDPEKMFESIQPVIHSQMMINNRVIEDLPAACCQSEVIDELKHYGGVLDSLGVLPAPFRLSNVLSPENIEHLYNLFKVKGLSYGNLSARASLPEIAPMAFWMTARGVDKAHLQGVGHDIMLVTGYDAKEGLILVHVPPGSNTRIRVSVDAIEHILIYQTFPEVGAILHVHAWMQGVPATHQNFPCGTLELAEEVVSLLKTTDQPHRSAVGLKNHGLTITGASLKEIFSRVEGKLLKEVPMML